MNTGASGTALWHHPGLPVVPLPWVLVPDPLGKNRHNQCRFSQVVGM
jgi:hypothetical protein